MKVNTLNFGEMEWEAEQVITFPQGIPGFELLRHFVILQPDGNVPFSYLQSVEEGHVSFLLTNPFLFYPDYELHLTESNQEELEVEDEKDVIVWSIVSIHGNIQESTINLLAPVIINMNRRLGKQIILHNTDYRTKHQLISLAPFDQQEAKG